MPNHKKRVVVKRTLEDGSKIKSVESRIKSRQVSKNNVIKKTVTKKDGVKHVEKERGKRRVVKTRSRI